MTELEFLHSLDRPETGDLSISQLPLTIGFPIPALGQPQVSTHTRLMTFALPMSANEVTGIFAGLARPTATLQLAVIPAGSGRKARWCFPSGERRLDR